MFTTNQNQNQNIDFLNLKNKNMFLIFCSELISFFKNKINKLINQNQNQNIDFLNLKNKNMDELKNNFKLNLNVMFYYIADQIDLFFNNKNIFNFFFIQVLIYIIFLKYLLIIIFKNIFMLIVNTNYSIFFFYYEEKIEYEEKFEKTNYLNIVCKGKFYNFMCIFENIIYYLFEEILILLFYIYHEIKI